MANTNYQNKRKYHIIYQTVNLTNGKIYIGAHSTDNLNDDYHGSGTNITRAIKKYGKNLFRRDILHIFETPEEMFLKEKEIVTPEFLKRLDVYNIVEGGYGGYNKGSSGLKHLHYPLTGERCAVHPNALDKMLLEGWKIGRNTSSTINTVWVYKNNKKKMISPTELSLYISKGWTKGLPKSFTKGKIWIYHNILNEYSLCEPHELQSKLSSGWVKKKWAPVKQGAVWVTKGSNNLRIDKSELDSYIANGWKRGMLTSRWK